MGYWWCYDCEREINSSRVTFEQTCDTCGEPVEAFDDGEGPLFVDTQYVDYLNSVQDPRD